MRLKDRVALITGAGGGIGGESALLFAAEGAAVVVADVNEAGGKETVERVKKAGGRALFVKADVSKDADCQRMVSEAERAFGRLHVLMNNAGIMDSADDDAVSTSEAVWERTTKPFCVLSNLASAVALEEAAFLTLGLCYEERPRFAGGVYHSVLKKTDEFFDEPLKKSLEKRKERAAALLALDDAVAEAVAALKARGFESPYLKNFVVARVNPLRFMRGATAPFDATVKRMTTSAKNFDPGKVKADQVAQASGPPAE